MAQPIIKGVHISHQFTLLFQRGQMHETVFPNHSHHIIEDGRQNDRLSEWRDRQDACGLTRLRECLSPRRRRRRLRWRSWLVPRSSPKVRRRSGDSSGICMRDWWRASSRSFTPGNVGNGMNPSVWSGSRSSSSAIMNFWKKVWTTSVARLLSARDIGVHERSLW